MPREQQDFYRPGVMADFYLKDPDLGPAHGIQPDRDGDVYVAIPGGFGSMTGGQRVHS